MSGVAAAVDGGRNQQRRAEMLSCIVRAERFRNPAMDVKLSDQNGALFEWKGGQDSFNLVCFDDSIGYLADKGKFKFCSKCQI